MKNTTTGKAVTQMGFAASFRSTTAFKQISEYLYHKKDGIVSHPSGET